MVRDFEGQWGLILGGSSGLGYASALKLAQHGMNLIIFYRAPRRDEQKIESKFDKIRAQGVELYAFNKDATREDLLEDLKTLVKEKLNGKSINLLLHSISKGNLKPLLGDNRLKNSDFTQTLNSMALSLHFWTQALIENDLFEKSARILSFTSEGSQRPSAGYAAVSVAKAALEMLTKSMAVELAPLGLRANCIQAGVTDTVSLKMIPDYEGIKNHATNRNPYQKLTTPERVADVVYLLCKREAQWINGTVIKVDGGESLR
ncbi:short-chain dehydrogenase [Nonlabens spongiae]|uniref:Short-chain dehydrogenase n=1 Tax=Nonlabens spongiae TaxID=331648 RepID=A0A1W6MHS7_9FLAO|nr:SDR family oxidoreductase [Nonlabens spongiae]ARN77151.1 short-chain dehydrogenase [Nonlabens spongiae]